MKIAFFEVSKDLENYFRAGLADFELEFFEEKLSVENVDKAQDAEIVSVFVGSAVSKEVVDALPNLKLLVTRSTGFDHLDKEALLAKGITITNVPAYGPHTVAEFAFGLILNLSRKIAFANKYVRNSPDFNFFADMRGFDLFGKTLGVIGTGRIGKNAVKIAKGFGMEVVAFDPYPDNNFAEENGFVYTSLEELLQQSDIITLHAPYTKENHHLLNKENMPLMKKGAYIINTARGDLIDTEALLEGLKSGAIAGAGLDVIEGERDLKSGTNSESKPVQDARELIAMENVIITPHIAFYSQEAEGEIIKTTIEDIHAFASGSPINLVK